VFLENVSGILSADLVGTDWADPAGTPVLLHVYRELERIGYSVRGGLFSARGIGAPHRRRRVFILAHAHGLRLADWVYHCCAEREQRIFARRSRAWPAPRGASAYEWEPIRVVDGPESTANFSKKTLDGLRRSALFHSEAEPALGRIVDGITNRMDYAELCQSRDSRVEELRLLGNGVVPDVAAQAFCTLMKETVDSMGIV
jgi:DNA (cytosine-5)-methyltransferase 1